ncbi:sigma-70 family RNA polymerase sigma factor [Enterococcus sp. AZ196]|uniref:sigma-70 family RNA polymerase sigma factor n=1 Tax=Enterococcus sp. AZ196 TaxID=2774659 RepID=UPI003D2D8425
MKRRDPIHSAREAQLVSYISTIIRNTATNYYRAKRRSLFRELLKEPDKVNQLLREKEYYQNQFSIHYSIEEELNNHLSRLPTRDLDLLVKKYVFEQTDEKIALSEGVTKQAINQRKKRLLEKLKVLLKNE